MRVVLVSVIIVAMSLGCGARTELAPAPERTVDATDARDTVDAAAPPIATAAALVGTYFGRLETTVTWVDPPTFQLGDGDGDIQFTIEADDATTFRMVFPYREESTLQMGSAMFPCVFPGRVVDGRALLEPGTMCRGVSLFVIDRTIVSGELTLDVNRARVRIEFASTLPLARDPIRFGTATRYDAHR